MNEKHSYTILQNDMLLNIRKPITAHTNEIWLMLHGWTGDEHSMDSFWHYIPESALIIAPRAPLPASPNGYGWANIKDAMFPDYESFLPAVDKLLSVLLFFLKENNLEHLKINLFGFSQGSAVSYMLSSLIPDKIELVIPVAGFMPDGTLNHLSNLPNRSLRFNVYHGAMDKLVPVTMAKEIVSDLQKLGYDPQLCVDEKAGHKFGTSCIEHLKSILN
ncbi:MAG: hypothetical protein JEZ00_08770 [Anaerolineaceae bacterium]|nr:hypothetical protein [Anaerolineaceae bacterium]